MTFRLRLLTLFAALAVWLAIDRCVHGQTAPKPISAADAVARRRAVHDRRLRAIDARALEAAKASAAAEASLRAATKARETAPPDPSPARVQALQRELVLFTHLEAVRRRRLNAAVDRLLLHQGAITDLDALVAARRRMPRARRGPLARHDAALAALVAFRTDLEAKRVTADRLAGERRRELEATAADRTNGEARLAEAARAWRAETERHDRDRASRRAALSKEKEALVAEESRLERERAAIAGRAREARLRLRGTLDADPGADGAAPALPELAANVRARAGIGAIVEARRALARTAESEARRLAETAAWHRASARYLERCREEGIRFPPDASFDPKLRLTAGAEADRKAAAQRAEAVRQHQAMARVAGSNAMLEDEAAMLRTRYLDRERPDALFPAPPPSRITASIDAGPDTSDELRRAGRALARAQETAIANRREIRASRERGHTRIAGALEAAERAACAPGSSDAAAAFDAALEAVAATASKYRVLLTAQRRLDLEVEACRSAWIRAGGRDAGAPIASRSWWEAFHAWTARLPGSGLLLVAVLVLLVLGWRARGIRRPAGLGEWLKVACGLGVLGLALVGLLRADTVAHALAGVGALGGGLLLWAVPLDLLAGMRLRFDGRGREGQMIQSGQLHGRVLQRGWLASTLVVERGDRAQVVRVGNRRLVQERAQRVAGRTGPQTAADVPSGAPELVFHVTLQSDWMAARQLVSLIGRRHDPQAEVRFRVENRRIRLTLRFTAGTEVDLDRVRVEVVQAVANAPFAEMAG